MAIQGIDVSHHQGSIDWNKVASTKKFAILKCSQGASYKDVKFDEYYSSAKNLMPLGCYIYNKVTSVATAKAEAEFAVKCLKGKSFPCGVWLDMEDASMRGLGKTMLASIILAEADILKDAGFNVGIYCNRDWYVNVLDSAKLKESFPFWIARYPSGDNGTYNEGSSLSPKDYSSAWQYSSKGSVLGITGNVDLDVAFTDLTTIWSSTASTAKTLKLSTQDAKNLQTILKENGFKGSNGKDLTIDGVFGINTKYALKEFCNWYGAQ